MLFCRLFFFGLSQLGFVVFHSLFQVVSWVLGKLIALVIHIVYVCEALPYARSRIIIFLWHR